MRNTFTKIIAGGMILLSLVSCKSEPVPIPENFEFSIRWNTYGVSSYDSKSGELKKTTDATVPEDYITTLTLSSEERQSAWEILSSLDWNKYPDAPENYDPGNGASIPSETIMLYVTYGDFEKMIYAKEISITHDADNRVGQAFLDACDDLTEMLMSSEEWASLPDYEVYYE